MRATKLVVILLLIGLTTPVFGGPKDAADPTALAALEGDTDSYATDINNRGDVAGRSVGTSTTAVIWDKRGNATALLPLSGDASSSGEAINSRGEVVGISRSEAGPCSAFGVDTAVVWNRHGASRALLPLPGDAETRGYGINDKGVAVGISLGPRRSDCTAAFTGVIWDRRGNPTPLTSPSAVLDETFGYDINKKGEVAGFNNTFDGSAFNATFWDRHGVPRNLSTFSSGNFELANGINKKRQVVGTDFVSFTGLVWDKRGNPTALPPQGTDIFSTAVDISDRGKIVGSSFSGAFVETAVIWDKHGVPTALSPLPGDSASSGLGINDRGHAAGHSVNADGTITAVVWR